MAEFNLTPVFRMEMFIDAIINGTTPPEPQFREEFYLAKMAGMDVDLPEPFTRRELYLAYLAGMDVDLPSPVTRDEMYLAEACGMDVTAPDPVFRDEFWLDELSGGGDEKYQEFTGKIIQFFASRAAAIKKMEVTLEPIQDLHGQDAPYPAGGSTNLCGFGAVDFTLNGIRYYTVNGILYMNGTSQGETSSSNSAFEALSFTLQAGTYYFYRMSSQIPVTVRDENNTSIVTNSGEFTLAEETTLHVGFYMYQRTISNQETTLMIVSGSTAPTVYVPYSNICPITGWTGCEVTRTGENIYGGDQLKDDFSAIGGTVDTTAKTVKTSASQMASKIFFAKFKENTRYTFIITANKESGNSRSMNLVVRYTDGTTDAPLLDGDVLSKQTVVFKTASNKTILNFGGAWGSGTTFYYYEECGVFEGDITADDFEPYSGTTLPITFPDSAGTVYGGTVDLVSGVLTVDRVLYVLDGSEDEGITSGSYGAKFKVYPPDGIRNSVAYPASSSELPDAISNLMKPVTQAATWKSSVNFFSMLINKYIYFNLANEVSSVAELRQYLAETNIVFCLKLKDSAKQTYQLTPQQISSLRGMNNIWSNSNGDLAVIAFGREVA